MTLYPIYIEYQNCIAASILDLMKGSILNLKLVYNTINRKIWGNCFPKSHILAIILSI